jgi:antitoxin ParD1/3/4
MAKLSIGLPDNMKQYVDAQTDSGRFADNDSYIQDLIRQDQERQLKIAAIQRLVDEGIASGESDESMPDILRSLKEKRSKSA